MGFCLAECPIWSPEIRSPQRGSRSDVIADESGSLEEFPGSLNALVALFALSPFSFSGQLSRALFVFCVIRDSYVTFKYAGIDSVKGVVFAACFEFASGKANRAVCAGMLFLESKDIKRPSFGRSNALMLY